MQVKDDTNTKADDGEIVHGWRGGHEAMAFESLPVLTKNDSENLQLPY